MDYIKQNINTIKANIAKACLQIGKNPADIMLLAASKQQTPDKIGHAISAGVDAVGENYCSELLEKYDRGAYQNAPLHFIGRFQSNKAKYLVGKTALIHSLCSKTGAESIQKQAKNLGITQEVLLQVNVAGEDAKAGLLENQIPEFLEFLSQMDSIKVRGLCSIVPQNQVDAHYFKKMRQLFVDISAKKYDNVIMEYLSMGMSGDYEQAILHGANIVRLGSVIFGSRVY